MSKFSKDEISFVEELPKHVDIECPVCLNILSEPHQVTCCGHNFCKSCIERVKASNGACPMCKERDFQAMVNKGHLRIINGLQVYCTKKEKGCKWKGELKNLSTHLNKGKREGECQYEEATCRYKCREIAQRQQLKHHEDKECLQRPFECQYCKLKGTYHSITEEHYKNCSKYPVLCPNKCTSTQMLRGSVTDHVNKECPLQPVDCVFSWAGCKERPLRKDIELHTTDTKHMMLLAVACGELKKENEKVKQEMASVHGELKKEIKELKDENKRLNDKDKKIMEELKEKDIHLHSLLSTTAYQILPIEIDHNFTFSSSASVTVHFYTNKYGQHLSARVYREVNIQTRTLIYTMLLASHAGKFDQFQSKFPTIFAKVDDKVIRLIEDSKALQNKLPYDILENITIKGPIPHGVIERELFVTCKQESLRDAVSVRIFTKSFA